MKIGVRNMNEKKLKILLMTGNRAEKLKGLSGVKNRLELWPSLAKYKEQVLAELSQHIAKCSFQLIRRK